MIHRQRRTHRVLCATMAVVLATVSVGCSSSESSSSSEAAASPDEAAESPDFGTMKNVCHEATGDNKPGKNGVTADSIKVTAISDAGSDLQKGLNQELWDASTVFTRWCNEHGGINGRKIELIQGDAQVVRYKEVIEQACEDSFALVGGGGAMDNTGEEARQDCGLISVPGFLASREARNAPLAYPAMSTGASEVSGGGLLYLKEKYGSDQKTGVVYGDFETTRFTAALRLKSAKDIGLASPDSPVNDAHNTYPITGLGDWRPVADGLLKSPARGAMFSGQPPDLGKLVTALAAQMPPGDDNQLKWLFSDENAYDDTVIRTGRAGLDRIPVYVQSFIYPFEEAGKGAKSKAMDDFLALFEHYLPNGKSHAMLAVYSFASWLLFAKAASACGDTLTRQCLKEKLESTGEFDAGGIIAARNPKNVKSSSKCFVLLKATSEGFEVVRDSELVQPSEGGHGVFNCSPKNVMTITSADLDATMEQLEAIKEAPADPPADPGAGEAPPPPAPKD